MDIGYVNILFLIKINGVPKNYNSNQKKIQEQNVLLFTFYIYVQKFSNLNMKIKIVYLFSYLKKNNEHKTLF